MDTKCLVLPPHKRFRLIHQEQEKEEHHQKFLAKKVKESRDPLLLPDSSAHCCLPAKKRVWALQPQEISQKQVSHFDLNLDYQPSLEDQEIKQENPPIPYDIGGDESKDDECGEDCEEDDDDGVVCAVCQSTDGEPSDPIVFCDGCNLMVHASCYGYPLVKAIPNGDWFCTQCSVSKSSQSEEFTCCLCPIKGGAMKPTIIDGQWTHIVCALFVPEVFFLDPEGREGIDCSQVPKRRWQRKCYICKKASGAVFDCSEPICPLAFHITCGLNKDLCLEYNERNKKSDVVAGFCKSHTDLWKKVNFDFYKLY